MARVLTSCLCVFGVELLGIGIVSWGGGGLYLALCKVLTVFHILVLLVSCRLFVRNFWKLFVLWVVVRLFI